MSKASSLAYQLRPNKAVDRELFLSMLMRLTSVFDFAHYKYIGLGGPFLEDFRMLHARLGISDMVSVEVEEAVHLRQKFNSPISSILCVHSTLEDYLDSNYLESPAIIWFDYTDPKLRLEQILRFAGTVGQVPLGSILRLTLNANPSSLGQPGKTDSVQDQHQWRLQRFRDQLGNLCPSTASTESVKQKNFGKCLLEAVVLAVEKELLSFPDRKCVWTLSTHYSDGQAMVTASLVVVDASDSTTEATVRRWEFFSTPRTPQVLDMPALSTIERLVMEASEDPKERLGFDLPESEMGENPFEAFKKFYRVFPHFTRVEL